ncbi:hypothetical protein QX220_00735 [Vibrio vulnificus]|nr:hypothetical protein [Vibrio vulnificus]MDS1860157.1 hypothetical protein [Vibrio vulnificus]
MPSLPHYVHQGLKFVPHLFTVPLDYDDPSKGTIEIFAREVNQHGDNAANKPWLVYFQGGPGFPAGRPMGNSGWIKRALQQYRVPVSCAVYADDMFVEMDFSRETLALIPSAKAWITNEYEHNGLRADGERILDVLIAMGKQTLANQTQ